MRARTKLRIFGQSALIGRISFMPRYMLVLLTTACIAFALHRSVDATEHAYPEDMGGASSTSNKKSKILHKTATVSEGVNDDTKVYSMKDVQDLLYNSTDLPLAKSGTDHLPVIVLAAGFKAIDELASAVLSTFKNNGRGVKLQGAETAWLQDFIGLPKTVRDSLEWDEFSDVAAFVSEVVRCVKLNTILVGAAAVWQSRRGSDHTIQLTVEEREELRVSVFWCFLLHAVTKKVTFQPRGSENCLLQQLVTAFDNKRKEIEWEKEKCFSKFFKMKGSRTHVLTHQSESLWHVHTYMYRPTHQYGE